MKTSALLLAFLCIVAPAAARMSHRSVPKCITKNKEPYNKLKSDGSYLGRNEAICDGPFALGISNDGTFALWKKKDIVEEFATDAYILQVADRNDAAFLSVENSEGTLIW